MMIMCAGKNCRRREACFRYVEDPLSELAMRHDVRIEPTLKHPDEKSCSKFCTTEMLSLNLP